MFIMNIIQLAFVIPPQATFNFINEYGGGNGDEIPDSILNSLCYQYRYDEWNRLVEKKYLVKVGNLWCMIRKID